METETFEKQNDGDSRPLEALVSGTPNWNNVEDDPLADIEITKNEDSTTVSWASEHIDEEFIGAVPTNSGWWVGRCMLFNGSGLHYLIEDVWEPAPYGIEDVTHYMWLPEKQ